MRIKSVVHITLLFLFVLQMNSLFAQLNSNKDIRFIGSESVSGGFDTYNVSEWEKDYHVENFNDSNICAIAYKSVLLHVPDSVNMILLNKEFHFEDLEFRIEDSLVFPRFKKLSEDTITLYLPDIKRDYALEIFAADVPVAKLQVVVYAPIAINAVIVPVVKTSLDVDSLETYLNEVYRQAGVRVNLAVAPMFQPYEWVKEPFANPSNAHDRYSDQMMDVRGAYLEQFAEKGSKPYYIFLIEGFTDETIEGYMVRNKGVAFVKASSENLNRTVAHQLGFGIGALEETWEDDGPTRNTTNNLMDDNGEGLTHRQWESIRQHCKTVSYYDDYENVRTNNGLIAYYIWEEDEDGNIILSTSGILKSIRRPFKRNTYSLHLDIDNFLFIHLFEIGGYPICALHILVLLLSIFLPAYVRRKFQKRFDSWQRFRLLRWLLRGIMVVLSAGLFFALFLLVNEGYYLFEVKSGKLEYLEGMSADQARHEMYHNVNHRRIQEDEMGSEILIKRGDEWVLKRRKNVLYFALQTNSEGEKVCRLIHHSDSLKIPEFGIREVANSHYFVVSHFDKDGDFTGQKVYNHEGLEITRKLKLKDPAKRILLFVNGYRPTSLGATFEENFEDIMNHGLEFGNSHNLIYSEDRYEYWKWNEISEMFEARLNPDQSFFADGHHSVETSNHRNLVDFTRLSQVYPKRCKNPDHHVCLKSSKRWNFLGISNEVNTVELHNLRPNKRGFKTRVKSGRVAGRNLYQIFNELPNGSENDTIYIVAHSMGYAYALGIIEKLRGKINFGGFYIIAAENASAGVVNQSEWGEIWQYGSDFEAHKYSAPCLIDGIAPQVKAGGLSPANRAYIPERLYKKMGFFESHFIGNYTWIFDIPSDQPGYIRQR